MIDAVKAVCKDLIIEYVGIIMAIEKTEPPLKKKRGRPKGKPGKVKGHNPDQKSRSLVLDFTGYAEVLKQLENKAHESMRSPEQHALWLIKQSLG